MKISRAHNIFGTIAVSLLLGMACNAQTTLDTKQLGGETNWLGDCSRSGQCNRGTCICGVCTDHCTAPSDCGDTESATCATSSGVLFKATCDDPDLPGICLARCKLDTDCEAGTECVAGACLRTAPSASKDGSDTAPAGARTTTVFSDRINLPTPNDTLGRCLPRMLTGSAGGPTACTLTEATPVAGACSCDAPGRRPARPADVRNTLRQVEDAGGCGTDSTPSCLDLCICEIEQETGADGEACLSDQAYEPAGWCYIDSDAGIGSSSLTQDCPDIHRRLLRLNATPGSTVTIQCAVTEDVSPIAGGPPGEIGDLCIPADEYRPDFSGFRETEVSLYEDPSACSSGLCLIHNFSGKISCPYGQDSGEAGACETPSGQPVTVPVRPQLILRPPEDAVLCSCRCDGSPKPEDDCACPSGFECRPLVEGVNHTPHAGSYCVKADTFLPNPSEISGAPECQTAGECD